MIVSGIRVAPIALRCQRRFHGLESHIPLQRTRYSHSADCTCLPSRISPWVGVPHTAPNEKAISYEVAFIYILVIDGRTHPLPGLSSIEGPCLQRYVELSLHPRYLK
jgi:hypothetical protein